MNEGYLRPEQFLFSVVTSVLVGLGMGVATRRSAEAEGRYPMEVLEIVGHSPSELSEGLARMEASMELGQEAEIGICTEALPTDEELEYIYWGMLAEGCHLSKPTARLVKGIPTTEFVLQKGSPQWQVIIPVLIPLFTIGLIAWSITRIEAISKALVSIILISGSLLIILAVVLRKPAEKYLERGGVIPRLPSTKKALAVK